MDYIALLTTSIYSKGVGGILRYSHEQFRNISKYSRGRFGIRKVTFRTETPRQVKSLDKFNILHNLTEYPLIPKGNGHSVRLGTANEFQILLHPELSSDPITKAQKIEYPKRKRGLQDILKSDYIIANSMQTKNEAYSMGFDKSRMFVVNLGVDRRFMRKKRARKVPKKKFMIGYIGALRRRKNLQFSFDTLKNLDKNKYEINFYGQVFSDFKRDLEQSLSRHKGAAFYNGIAPERRLVDIYDGFDVFLMPSLYEGFGLGIIEAQTRGLPVIVYRQGKIANETRKHCIIADDPAHAAQIIEDIKINGYDEKLRDRAIAYSRAFTWDNTAKRTLDVYKRILE